MDTEHLKKEVAAIGLGHRWQLLEKMLGQEIRLKLEEFTNKSISMVQSLVGGTPHALTTLYGQPIGTKPSRFYCAD